MICARQSEIVAKFKSMRVGALFMEMGTGKTKTILDIYRAKNINAKIVYVCPASLIQSTKKEVAKWGGDALNIEFFSSEGVSQSDREMMRLDRTLRRGNCFLVVDESIKFKNPDSKRTDRLLSVSHLAKWRFILNGTPITRSILDLLAQMDILDRRILNMSEAEFARRFLEYKLEGGGKAPWRSWSKPHNEEALLAMLEPYIAEASLDLGISTEIKDKSFNLTDKEALAYSQHKMEVLSGIFDKDAKFLEIAQRFQHHYTFCEAKFEEIREQAKKPNTLFFVKFKKWFEIMPELIGRRFGIFNSEQKDDLSEHDIAVLTYGTGAFGLNLQNFNRVVFVDATFDYGQKTQALARVRRHGQKAKLIEVINFWNNTGLEGIIKASLEKKSNTRAHVEEILRSMEIKEMEQKL